MTNEQLKIIRNVRDEHNKELELLFELMVERALNQLDIDITDENSELLTVVFAQLYGSRLPVISSTINVLANRRLKGKQDEQI